MRYSIFIVTALFLFLFSYPVFAEKVVFVVPLYTGALSGETEKTGGLEDNAANFLTKICEILKKKTGDDVICKTVPKTTDALLTPQNTKKFIKSLEGLNYNGMYISGSDYYHLVLSGYKDLKPGVGLSFFKKSYDQACVYTRREDKIEKIEDLRGKRWGGSYFYLPTRYILYKNGIDQTPQSFFGSAQFISVDAWSSMAVELVEKKVDVFVGTMEEESVGSNRDKRFNTIKRSFCVPHRSTHIIAFHKSFPKEKAEQYRKILLNAHKDKDFQPFWFIFTAIQGHFIPFDETAYKYTKDFIDTAEKRGWIREQLDFIYKTAKK